MKSFFLRMLIVEIVKLRLGLVLATVILVPCFMVGLFGWGGIWSDEPKRVMQSIQLSLYLWGSFVAPVSCAVLAVAMARNEHLGRGWDFIYTALPSPTSVIVAKLFVGILAAVAMGLLHYAVMFISMWFSMNHHNNGAMFNEIFARSWIISIYASLALAPCFLAIYWIAIRVRNPIPALVFCIFATIIGIAGVKISWLLYWPWSLALRIVNDLVDLRNGFLITLGLTVMTFLCAVFDLSRSGRQLTR